MSSYIMKHIKISKIIDYRYIKVKKNKSIYIIIGEVKRKSI